MGSFSIWHWIIVLLIVLLLFGAGKLPSVMGDIAKGVKAFKAGLKDEEAEAAAQAQPAPPPVTTQPPPAAPHQPAPALDPAHVKPAQPGATVAADPAKPHQG
ncbi:twin-arginine translocase TatA/TatE family subunit [Azospirillum doebereinerae]|uniref:twin-arginine translocase TatA/TatE family subunit n=1 Tax=Azospirillum doebereinerae TaxID=92933 RepID=UPI001EE62108|nr:twin-arginine translocase TatA/TatE family subunit [Azospirillum doebereinerae]MCG5243576.1 twin-arginine translocase TatA/TatE family subunit [Azospirillum doebereinerae]